jgi:hypothetical protein
MRIRNQLVIGSCIAIAVMAFVAGSQGDARNAALQRSELLAECNVDSVPNQLRLATEQLGPQGGCGAQCGRLAFCCGGCFAGECQECCPLSSPPVPDGNE